MIFASKVIFSQSHSYKKEWEKSIYRAPYFLDIELQRHLTLLMKNYSHGMIVFTDLINTCTNKLNLHRMQLELPSWRINKKMIWQNWFLRNLEVTNKHRYGMVELRLIICSKCLNSISLTRTIVVRYALILSCQFIWLVMQKVWFVYGNISKLDYSV